MDDKDLQIFNLSMQIWQLKNSYEYKNILNQIKDTKNLMACDSYYTKNLRSVLIEFEYEKVENYFIEKSKEEVQEND